MNAFLEHVAQKLNTATIVAFPFPHLVVDEFLPAALFKQLSADYPSSQDFNQAHRSSRARLNLMFQDNGFTSLIHQSKAFYDLYQLLRSDDYIKLMCKAFEQDFMRQGALLTHEDSLRSRFDIAWAGDGYTRSCHLDRRNHAIASLLYFNSQVQFGGTGGSLLLYSTTQSAPFDKFPPSESIAVEKKVPPKENRFVAFLNCSNAYHGIEAMRQSTGLRKFLYSSIDNKSRSDMWPPVVVFNEARRQSFIHE